MRKSTVQHVIHVCLFFFNFNFDSFFFFINIFFFIDFFFDFFLLAVVLVSSASRLLRRRRCCVAAAASASARAMSDPVLGSTQPAKVAPAAATAAAAANPTPPGHSCSHRSAGRQSKCPNFETKTGNTTKPPVPRSKLWPKERPPCVIF